VSEVELSQTLSEAFNVDTEEGSSFDLVPVGNYVAIITYAMVGNLKSGNGQSIRMTWQIQGGDYDGRKVWDQVILFHTSTEAMKFGRRKLKDIADACGVSGPITDLTVLLDKPVSVYVKIEQDKAGEFPPKNRIGRVKPIAAPAKTNGDKPAFNDQIPF
jgi:uncharacterized protein DUF669